MDKTTENVLQTPTGYEKTQQEFLLEFGNTGLTRETEFLAETKTP